MKGDILGLSLHYGTNKYPKVGSIYIYIFFKKKQDQMGYDLLLVWVLFLFVDNDHGHVNYFAAV